MEIKKTLIRRAIKEKLMKLEYHLPLRIQNLLELLISEEMKKTKGDKVEIVDLMIHLILQADRDPASMIANLLASLENESVSRLEDWTISTSGSFLKDYLKKDYVLYILKSHELESKKAKRL